MKVEHFKILEWKNDKSKIIEILKKLWYYAESAPIGSQAKEPTIKGIANEINSLYQQEVSAEEMLEQAEKMSEKRQYSDQGFQIYITGFEDCFNWLNQSPTAPIESEPMSWFMAAKDVTKAYKNLIESEQGKEDEETKLLDSINRGLRRWKFKDKLSSDDALELLFALQDEIVGYSPDQSNPTNKSDDNREDNQ